MESLFYLVIGLLVGYFIYGIVSEYKKYKMLKQLDSVVEEKLEMLRSRIINSRIEESEGMLFLYNDQTNEFLGQGKDLDELEKAVQEKYPNKLFNVPQSEIDKYRKDFNA